MHVLSDAESEMSHVAPIAEPSLVDVDTGAEQLDDVEREIRKMLRVGRAATR
jgi:hypothetical protein